MTKSLHPILYTSALWIIGACLSIIYALTHDIGNIRMYQIVYEQPAHATKQVASAADIFSPAEK